MAKSGKHYQVMQLVDIDTATTPEDAARQAYAQISGMHDVLPLMRVVEIDENGIPMERYATMIDLEEVGLEPAGKTAKPRSAPPAK